MRDHVYVISEIGSNFNGSLEIAKQYIRASKAAGADAVKFQSIRKDRLIAPRVFEDGRSVDNPIYRNCTFCELPDEWYPELKEEANKADIEFVSTPFYLEAVDILESIGVSTYKIASGDITFYPLLEKVGRTGKRIILSTGASGLPEIEIALKKLREAGAGEIVLLHCVSNYPPEWSEINLLAMATLQKHFNLPVGISDHSPGNLIPIAAVALGAVVIEKHVTFDRSLAGPDHPYAMTMEEFGDMIRQVRLLEQALGSGDKVPTRTELLKQRRIRRGIYDPNSLEHSESPDGLWLRPQYK
jgi:N,N'-diacetyllegionaminate synthase